MISYAGVSLMGQCPSTTDLLATLAVQLDPTGEADAAPQNWGLPDATGHRGRVGVLRWPNTASRWASFCALATDAQADAIREAVRRASGAALPLVLADGVRSITVPLSLLPPRPLAQVVPGQGGWLLDLVDARHFWRGLGVEDVVTAAPTTWDGLIAACGTALGVALTADTVPAAYLAPPVDLTAYWAGDLPGLLDAAATAVGMVVVRRLAGTVEVMGPATSMARHQANLALASRLAGGEMGLR